MAADGRKLRSVPWRKPVIWTRRWGFPVLTAAMYAYRPFASAIARLVIFAVIRNTCGMPRELINLSVPCEKDHAFVDITNSGGQEICQWIEENGLGKATGRQQRSGFCIYPEYHFDARRLKELDREGYEKYVAGLQQRGRSAKSNSRPVR